MTGCLQNPTYDAVAAAGKLPGSMLGGVDMQRNADAKGPYSNDARLNGGAIIHDSL